MSEEMINLASDIRCELYPQSSEALSDWHFHNPERIIVSDGHVTFSISKETAKFIGVGGEYREL